MLQLSEQPRQLAAERALVNGVHSRDRLETICSGVRDAPSNSQTRAAVLFSSKIRLVRRSTRTPVRPIRLATTSARGRLGVSGEVTSAMISVQF